MMPVSELRDVIEPVADTKVPIEAKPIVEVLAYRVEPVATVNPREVTKEEVPVEAPKKRLVVKRFVLVVFTPVALVHVRPVTPRTETVRFVKAAFVAKRFVEVAFVEVTLPKEPFQRAEALPREKARSEEGMRFELTTPERERFVPVAERNVVFWREVVPVAVRSDTVSPPKSWSDVVVKLPRAVAL